MPRPAWIPIYLKVVGWPDDWQNSLALDLWALSEGMAPSWHNYLATGLVSANCEYKAQLPDGSANTFHVAYCQTDVAGAYNFRDNMQAAIYAGINEAFHMPTGKTKLEEIYLAINRTAYCPNCQGGRYPIALYRYVYGRVPPKDRPGLTKPPLFPPPPKAVKQPVSMFNGWAYLVRQLHHGVPEEMKRVRAAGTTSLRVVKWSKRRPRKP